MRAWRRSETKSAAQPKCDCSRQVTCEPPFALAAQMRIEVRTGRRVCAFSPQLWQNRPSLVNSRVKKSSKALRFADFFGWHAKCIMLRPGWGHLEIIARTLRPPTAEEFVFLPSRSTVSCGTAATVDPISSRSPTRCSSSSRASFVTRKKQLSNDLSTGVEPPEKRKRFGPMAP